MKTNYNILKTMGLACLIIAGFSSTSVANNCTFVNVITASKLETLYKTAGANVNNTYYDGLSASMGLKANPSGGIGPYTYQWSTQSGTISGTTNKAASLLYPSAATWVKVSITDVGANCTKMDSIFIDYVEFTCNKPSIWYYQLRNKLTKAVSCVQGTSAMRALLQTGNYVFYRNCASTSVITASSLAQNYKNAGASQANTYYLGLSATMTITASPVGGVGPFTYNWTSKSGYTLVNSKKQNAGLIYPTGPGWIKVSITDIGASCTILDSIYIDFVDFTCNKPYIWWYEVCNTTTAITSCVHGTTNLQVLLQTGNYQFGSCAPKSDLPIAQEKLKVFPNPSKTDLNISMAVLANAKGSVEIIDLKGRILYKEVVNMTAGTFEHNISTKDFSNGVYTIRIVTTGDMLSERIVIQH